MIGAAQPAVPARFADVDLALMLVGKGALPTAIEREKLFGWVAWRYALTADLDPSNPYISAPPTA